MYVIVFCKVVLSWSANFALHASKHPKIHAHARIPTYMHECIHAYSIHTCILTCSHTRRHTHIHTCTQTYTQSHAQTYTDSHTDINTDTHTYMHAYLHTTMQTLMQTYMHPSIHPCIHPCIQPPIHRSTHPPCRHTYVHTNMDSHAQYIHTYIHTYIHAYMHTCIHAYMHTCIHAYICKQTYTHTYIYRYSKRMDKQKPACLCVCTYIYIYAHTHTREVLDRGWPDCRAGPSALVRAAPSGWAAPIVGVPACFLWPETKLVGGAVFLYFCLGFTSATFLGLRVVCRLFSVLGLGLPLLRCQGASMNSWKVRGPQHQSQSQTIKLRFAHESHNENCNSHGP